MVVTHEGYDYTVETVKVPFRINGVKFIILLVTMLMVTMHMVTMLMVTMLKVTLLMVTILYIT